jgi:hypothetical protein
MFAVDVPGSAITDPLRLSRSISLSLGVPSF